MSTMEKAFAEQVSNSKFATPVSKADRRGCYYTSVPRFVKRKGIRSEEITSLNHDKTQLLESILVKEYGSSEELLLGELQFAFVAFLMGQSLEGFLQWKLLVSLLFKSLCITQMLSCVFEVLDDKDELMMIDSRVID